MNSTDTPSTTNASQLVEAKGVISECSGRLDNAKHTPNNGSRKPSYLIITPAHNEAEIIEHTIRSMVAQTVRPVKWIVVNDGSVDRTGEIVQEWANRFAFIQLVNLRRDAERNFARKVVAFNRGLEMARGLEYDYIGNVDADISFGADYFENILAEFKSDPSLGLGGGIVYTKFSREFVTYDTTLDSVGGKVQLFRRQCFQDIGGYRPLRYGGIDATAEIMSRMKGWKVRKSLVNRVFEHRPTGFAHGRPFKTMLRDGRKFHSLGYGPVFYLLRCIYRVRDYPLIVGSAAAMAGYLWSMIRREPIALPPDVVEFLRAEHRTKLKQSLGFG
jgi:poly-beta-1,6-N-acetyl-D-glucosamine synthase